MPTISRAKLDDLDFIRSCAGEAYGGYVAAIGKEPAPMVADFAMHLERSELFIIIHAGQRAGYIVWWTRNGNLMVDNIALLPEHQGKGLARQIFRELEKVGKASGASNIELYTNAKMLDNLNLYPRLGFAEIERRMENGFDRVFFRKPLT